MTITKVNAGTTKLEFAREVERFLDTFSKAIEEYPTKAEFKEIVKISAESIANILETPTTIKVTRKVSEASVTIYANGDKQLKFVLIHENGKFFLSPYNVSAYGEFEISHLGKLIII